MKVTLTIAAALSLALPLANAQNQDRRVVPAERVSRSIPLRDMPIVPPGLSRAPFAIPNKFWKPGVHELAPDRPSFQDAAAQTQEGQLASTVGVNFEGVSNDDNGAVLGYRVVPPDVQGDVGPNHYVQWINSSAEIFDKSGNSLMGPFPGNQFFQGMGGACENENAGDPIVLYDHLADRWMVSQFTSDTSPYFECIAVSATSDPLGSYYQYAFNFGGDFPDYPKLAVWPDGYYMTTRNFYLKSVYTGIKAVAFERSKMLSGQPAIMVITDIPGGTANDGWLPADLDGPAPPAGTSGIFAGAPRTTGSSEIQLYEYNVNWTAPLNSTFDPIATISVPPWDESVYSVSQPAPGEALDVLPYFLMHRLQYRNFGTHEMLLMNHTVDVGSNTAGIRWYELHNTGGSWFTHQEGTFAPADGLDRWMGSISMNGQGDIALAYSVVGPSTFPSIRFAGQTAANSGTGIFDVAETEIVAGGGVQTNSYGRWGDYTAMSVDPTDDLTFWYTGEYYANTNSFDFKTRITSFQLGAGTPPPPPPSATDVHVSNIVVGDTGGRTKFGTATVTITDDTGQPVSGAVVEGTFSGHLSGQATGSTGADGTVTLQTSDSKRGKVDVSFCVDDVTAALPYDPADNTDTSYACSTDPPPGGDATTMHVASVSTGQSGIGKGLKVGTATVQIVDNLGNAVFAVTVTGDFSGDFAETGTTASTDGNGTADFETSGSKTGKVDVSFCVSNVTGGSLTYQPDDNAAGTTCPASAAKGLIAAETPGGFVLNQNYPNPFNPTTIVTYSLPEASHVQLRVFNMLGQQVGNLVDGVREAGDHRVTFDASGLTPGVYVYLLSAGDVQITRRMTLLK